MRRLFIGLAGLLLLDVAAASAQQQVRFTGTTRADPVLIKDTLQTIAQFGASRGCRTLDGVEAEVLPESYVPSKPGYRLGTGALWRERWTVSMCGMSERFLMTFWPAAQSGTDFGIGYPYPDDAP